MKKIPQTLTGRVFGFVFFAIMIFGGFFGNTTSTFAQQAALQTSGNAPQLDSTSGKYTWTININGQNIPTGSPINVIIEKSGVAFENSTVTLPPPPQIQTVSYTVQNLDPGTTYSAFAEYNTNVSNITSITTPTSQQTGNTQNQTTPPTPSSDGGIPKCWLGLTQGFDVWGCGAQVIYYLLFVPTSFLLALSGQFMDFLLAYTLDSDSYSVGNFVGQGWKLVRDLTNILFIFILVSIGIGTIIGNSKLGDKKLIGWVIIVALLINFSLFFTKVLIDAGNILGTVFYSAMGVKASDTTSAITNNSLFTGGEKSISVAIVSKFNPQTIFSEINSLSINVPNPAGTLETIDTGTPPGWFTMVSLILSIINIVTAYTFFVVGLLFMGRVVGLWIAMMLSPLAFMSLAVPSYLSFLFSEYKFSSWAEKVAKLSFSAPIFLFFLYIVLSILKGGFLKEALSVTSDMTSVEKFLSTLVPFVIITMLILKAKDVTVKMSDEIGRKFASWGESLGSLAVGGALAVGTGGAALAMRGTVGRGAMALSRSQTLQNAKSKTGLTGLAARLTLRGTDKLSKASFDARNTAAADALKKSPLGLDLKKNAIGNAFLGTDDKNRGLFGSTSGGLEGMNKRREADIVKEAEERQLKGLAFENQDKKAKEYKAAIENERSIHDANYNQRKAAALSSNQYQNDLAYNKRLAQSRGETLDENKFNESYLNSLNIKPFDEEAFKRSYEAKNGNRSSMSGSEYNADVVKEFKQEVEKGNYGVGGVIKKSIENKTGIDLNQASIPNYGKAGIIGGVAAVGGIPVAAPVIGAGMISRGVGGFEKNERASALKAIDKKFSNKDLESVTNELKKIDADIKNYLAEYLTKPPHNMSEDQIKNLTNFEKQTKLSEIRKNKEKESRNIKFERDEKNEQYKRETDPKKKADLKNEILSLDEQQSNLRDEIDSLKNLFDRKEKKEEAKEKIENKINPKEKKDDKGGGEKKDDKK